MPRDSSGNYTLPLGNPVVDGTIIDTEWANPTMADIAVQLNNVLTRDGLLGPTAPVFFVDGTEALPGLAFASNHATGIYRPGGGGLGFSVSGTKSIEVAPSGVATFFSGVTLGDAAGDAFTINSSTASIPNGLNFTGGNVGLGVAPSTSQLDVNGAVTVRGAAGANFIDLQGAGNASPPAGMAYGLFPQSGVGLGLSSGVAVALWTAGAERLRIDASGNVGINTPIPVSFPGFATLEVKGRSAGVGGLFRATSGDGAVSADFYIASGKGYVGTFTNHPFAVITNGTERVQVDMAGNIAMGLANSTQGRLTVAEAGYVGAITLCGSAEPARYGTRIVSSVDGGQTSLTFNINQNNSGFIERIRIDAEGHTTPGTDNAQTLGSAAKRWSVVYAVTGAINTSDQRDKQDIEEVSAAEHAVAVRLRGLMRSFRFKDAVEAKGEAARIHFGIVAQDVEEAFYAEGLDPSQYGLFCYDQWEDGDSFGIRYDELFAFIIAAL